MQRLAGVVFPTKGLPLHCSWQMAVLVAGDVQSGCWCTIGFRILVAPGMMRLWMPIWSSHLQTSLFVALRSGEVHALFQSICCDAEQIVGEQLRKKERGQKNVTWQLAANVEEVQKVQGT